jgi:hypothetical protein
MAASLLFKFYEHILSQQLGILRFPKQKQKVYGTVAWRVVQTKYIGSRKLSYSKGLSN